MADESLYDTDIVAWADQQAGELRRLSQSTSSNVLDWPNLIEEIESVGRSQVSGVERKFVLILSHLLKTMSAPDSPAARGWRAEVASHQRVVRKQFSGAMRRLIAIDDVWTDAQAEARDALAEWGDSLVRGLPSRSPFRLDDLVASDFDVDTALAVVAGAVRDRRS